MQSNKFPPSLLFFSYSVFFLLIFGGQISKACVSLCHNKFIIYKIVHIYAKEGYLIYLYQIILFYPLRLIFMKLHEANVNYHIPIEILLVLLSFIYIILSGALLGYVIGTIRKKNMFLYRSKVLKLVFFWANAFLERTRKSSGLDSRRFSRKNVCQLYPTGREWGNFCPR